MSEVILVRKRGIKERFKNAVMDASIGGIVGGIIGGGGALLAFDSDPETGAQLGEEVGEEVVSSLSKAEGAVVDMLKNFVPKSMEYAVEPAVNVGERSAIIGAVIGGRPFTERIKEELNLEPEGQAR